MKLFNFIITIYAVFLLSFPALSQPISKQYLPEKVVNTFENLFPDAKKEKWQKVKTNFEVSYEKVGKSYQSVFTEEGIWLSTTTAIKEEDLPQKIKDYLSTEYKKYTVDNTAIEDRADGKFYLVTMAKNDTKAKLLFDLQGEFLKEEKEKK